MTNDAGLTWLGRHLGDGYRVHQVTHRCRQPMHATLDVRRRGLLQSCF